MGDVRFSTSCEGVDWKALKAALAADDFDNGRTPAGYERSARGSHTNVFAFDGEAIVGNARALSDGVCNAYIVDVWVQSEYRRRGIGSAMIKMLLERLVGQHVYLVTDHHTAFYASLGFREQPVGMSLVVGEWLGGEKA